MPSKLALLLPLVSVIADDHTTTELSTGAIAGIVIGILLAISCIGAVLASYLTERESSRRESRRSLVAPDAADDKELKLRREQLKAAEDELISSRFGDNNLPMMAMRVNADDATLLPSR